MPKKETKDESLIQTSTILTFVAYFLLNGVFLYLLNSVLGDKFSWVDFILVIVLTVVITGFLVVVRSVIRVNSLEGLILGVATIVVAIAALLIKFNGKYTYIFATIGALIALAHMGYFYWQSRKANS